MDIYQFVTVSNGLFLDQRSLTDAYDSASWNRNTDFSHRLASRIHYRLALMEVGYPLRYLQGTKELIHGTRTAYIGK